MISRATAYRYFPGLDALLVEAALDVAMPEPEVLRDGPKGLGERLERVDDAIDAVVSANEAPLRTMMIHALQARLRGEDALPVRQNRRVPLIRAAIDGADGPIAPEAGKRLAQAMALIVGTEAMIVCKDVLQIGDAEAREVRRWAIRALAAAATRSTE